MMNKIGIVVCGNSGVDYLRLDYPVKVIHSILNLDGKEYEDFVDITAEEFYKKVVNEPDVSISTSQTPTGVIAQTYESLKDEGYTDIISIVISSKLSGTYQGAKLAEDMVDGINVCVIDSKSVAHGEYYLVRRAIEMIKLGHSVEEIEKDLLALRENIKIFVLVDTLKYLVKNGRLSVASGFLGSLLKIKPLLHITEEGALVPLEKIRTTSKARERLLEILQEQIKSLDVEVFIAYTNNLEDAKELKNKILANHPSIVVDLVPLTPVVGAHAGPGTIGVGYLKRS
jgi:DegV family protein with EDD domain